MKYLLLLVLLMGCNDMLESNNEMTFEKVEEIKMENTETAQVPDIPKMSFTDVIDCTEQFVKLHRQCNTRKTKPIKRPDDAHALVPQCLWAMNGVYGNKFPLDNDTRSDFFFKCIDEYPETNREFCQYTLKGVRRAKKHMEEDLDESRNRCFEICEMVPRHKLDKVMGFKGFGCSAICW